MRESSASTYVSPSLTERETMSKYSLSLSIQTTPSTRPISSSCSFCPLSSLDKETDVRLSGSTLFLSKKKFSQVHPAKFHERKSLISNDKSARQLLHSPFRKLLSELGKS